MAGRSVTPSDASLRLLIQFRGSQSSEQPSSGHPSSASRSLHAAALWRRRPRQPPMARSVRAVRREALRPRSHSLIDRCDTARFTGLAALFVLCLSRSGRRGTGTAPGHQRPALPGIRCRSGGLAALAWSSTAGAVGGGFGAAVGVDGPAHTERPERDDYGVQVLETHGRRGVPPTRLFAPSTP
jgi:hypothetical protein